MSSCVRQDNSYRVQGLQTDHTHHAYKQQAMEFQNCALNSNLDKKNSLASHILPPKLIKTFDYALIINVISQNTAPSNIRSNIRWTGS